MWGGAAGARLGVRRAGRRAAGGVAPGAAQVHLRAPHQRVPRRDLPQLPRTSEPLARVWQPKSLPYEHKGWHLAAGVHKAGVQRGQARARRRPRGAAARPAGARAIQRRAVGHVVQPVGLRTACPVQAWASRCAVSQRVSAHAASAPARGLRHAGLQCAGAGTPGPCSVRDSGRPAPGRSAGAPGA